MDIVYVLGTGSHLNNLEIQCSIASIRKYGRGVGNIYVVGEEVPKSWGAKYWLPYQDCGKNKEDNIRRKIEGICVMPDVSDNFLFVNDDHFFTRPFDVENYPFYYEQTLIRAHQLKRKNGQYKCALENTYLALGLREFKLRYFDVHTPIIYNKDLFLRVMQQYDWNKMHGYCIKSLYANTLKIEGTPYVDLKIFQQFEERRNLDLAIGDRHVFSIDDAAINNIMIEKLKEL